MRHVFSALLILVATAVSAQVTNQNLFDTVGFMQDHYTMRKAQYEKEVHTPGKIVFLGNSITELGKWTELTGRKDVINRGIAGDITFGVLARLNEVISRKPSKLFILIGINDIGKDIPAEVIADNCRKMVRRMKAGSPDTKIYLQSILPVNPTVNRFPQHYDKEHQVIRTNELLKKAAVDENISFLNLYPRFLDQRQLMRSDLTIDGLHLNEAGYKIWIDFLKETQSL